MIELKRAYTSVLYGGTPGYGGDQRRSGSTVIADCGCGVVAAADALLYLSRSHPEYMQPYLPTYRAGDAISGEDYERLLKKLSPRFFPLIPRFGINGLMLAAGLNRLFMRSGIALRAGWGVPSGKLTESVKAMLERDIPVILSVGPNFPKLWGDERLRFYVSPDGDGSSGFAKVRSHYVVVTAMDGGHFQVSSWGKKYYIDIGEYAEYARKRSSPLLSSVMNIR